MLKNIISSLLVFSCIFSINIRACADLHEEEPAFDRGDAIVQEFVLGLLSSGSDKYAVYDKDGNRITEQFAEEIKPFAAKEEWEKIDAYCSEHSLTLMEELTSSTTEERGLENRKTQTERCIAYVDSTNSPDGTTYSKKVIYDLLGVITYDPNTGVISDAEAQITDMILPEDCRYKRMDCDAIIRANRYTTEITGEVVILWNNYTIEGYPLGYDLIFEPAECSFTMDSDPV